MKHAKQNRLISVDAETGFHWYGEQVLRHKLLVEKAFEQEMTEHDASFHRSARVADEGEPHFNCLR